MFSDILLTVDYDRTLTAPDSTIPERNLEAIRYFMDNGGTFTLNTGRSLPMAVNNILPYVSFNAPLLLYNGSADYDSQKKEFVRFHPIDLNPQLFIEDLQSSFPTITLVIPGIDAHYCCSKNEAWEQYARNNNCVGKYVATNAIPHPFLKVALHSKFESSEVSSMYHADPDELQLLEEVTAYIKEKYGDKVDLFRACARIIDIHAKGCSKLRSARELQAALGKKILICVGDAENDLTMLEGADFAYCPADGVVADRFENVCECGKGAIADVIYEKIPALLQNKP